MTTLFDWFRIKTSQNWKFDIKCLLIVQNIMRPRIAWFVPNIYKPWAVFYGETSGELKASLLLNFIKSNSNRQYIRFGHWAREWRIVLFGFKGKMFIWRLSGEWTMSPIIIYELHSSLNVSHCFKNHPINACGENKYSVRILQELQLL